MGWFEILKSRNPENVEKSLNGIIEKNFKRFRTYKYSNLHELQKFLVDGLIFGENGSVKGRIAASNAMGKRNYTLNESKVLNGLSLLGFTGYLKRINYNFKAPLEGFKGDKDKLRIVGNVEGGNTKINAPRLDVTVQRRKYKDDNNYYYVIEGHASCRNHLRIILYFSLDINENNKTETFHNKFKARDGGTIYHSTNVDKENLDLFIANTKPETYFRYSIHFESKFLEPSDPYINNYGTLAGHTIAVSHDFGGYSTNYKYAHGMSINSTNELISNTIEILEPKVEAVLQALEKKEFEESNKTTLRDELYGDDY